jgi:hypothetical protein
MENKYLWMSFVSEDDVFNGVIVSDNIDLIESTVITHELGINPGGQIAGFEIPESEIKKEHLWKLMSKQDLIDYGYIDPDNCRLGDLEK